MDRTYDINAFCEDCREMNVTLSAEQLAQFQRYYECLTQWNAFMNLTAVTDYGEVLKKHFLDSLALAKAADLKKVRRLIDIGTGAGFPGIPIKIAFPQMEVVLLDSLGKRVKFLDHVISELQLSQITAIHGRAEEFAKSDDYRERFDLAVSRAVANLSTLCEYCIPYTKLHGAFISYKSGKIEEELQAAQNAIAALGGKTENICKFSLQDVEERSLVVIRKTRATPNKYPRKAGTSSREPLS